MAGSFMQSARKQIVDVSQFLKEAADGAGVKYRPESGKQHRIYVPWQETEMEVDGVKKQGRGLIAISGSTHEWNDSAGKYHATVCLDGIVRKAEDGTVINTGSCPFCKRVSDAWDIYNYRMEQEEANCTLQGDYRKKHLEGCKQNFSKELKARKAKPYLYMLVAQFKSTDAGEPVIDTATQLPAYELKIMKVSATKVEGKIAKQCKNSGVDVPGSEILFDYPVNDDPMQVSLNVTVSPVVLDNLKWITKYPGLENQILSDATKFNWDELEQAFPEWKGMTSMEAEDTVEQMFQKWDEYKETLKINPTAKYLEYTSEITGTNVPLAPQVPNINGVAMPQIPVQQPNVAGVVSQQASIPGIPNVPQQPAASQQVAQQAAVQQPVTQPTETQNIPGMPQQTAAQQTTATQDIPGMPRQTAQPEASQSGVATAANGILGGGVQTPTFKI